MSFPYTVTRTASHGSDFTPNASNYRLICTASLTLTLPDTTTVPNIEYSVVPTSGTTTIHVTGSDTINGLASSTISAGSFRRIWNDASGHWYLC